MAGVKVQPDLDQSAGADVADDHARVPACVLDLAIELPGGVDGLSVEFDDDIARFQTGVGCSRAVRDVGNHEPVSMAMMMCVTMTMMVESAGGRWHQEAQDSERQSQ